MSSHNGNNNNDNSHGDAGNSNGNDNAEITTMMLLIMVLMVLIVTFTFKENFDFVCNFYYHIYQGLTAIFVLLGIHVILDQDVFGKLQFHFSYLKREREERERQQRELERRLEQQRLEEEREAARREQERQREERQRQQRQEDRRWQRDLILYKIYQLTGDINDPVYRRVIRSFVTRQPHLIRPPFYSWREIDLFLNRFHLLIIQVPNSVGGISINCWYNYDRPNAIAIAAHTDYQFFIDGIVELFERQGGSTVDGMSTNRDDISAYLRNAHRVLLKAGAPATFRVTNNTTERYTTIFMRRGT